MKKKFLFTFSGFDTSIKKAIFNGIDSKYRYKNDDRVVIVEVN